MASRYEVHIPPAGAGGTPPPVEVVQTVRDAHVIVVAQSGYLTALSSVASPPLATNALDLDPGVGDVVGVTCDYLDTGDGAHLQLALAAAAAAAIPVDIRLRPCSIVLPTAQTLTVPAGCRLIGAGEGISTITGNDGTGGNSQRILTLGDGASVENMTLISPAPVEEPGFSSQDRGLVQGGAGSAVRDCTIRSTRSSAFSKQANVGVHFASPNGREEVVDCTMYLDSLLTQAVPDDTAAAVLFGWSGATGFNTLTDPTVRNLRLDEQSKNVGSVSKNVVFLQCEGGEVENIEHRQCRVPSATGSLEWRWTIALLGATAPIRGPRIDGFRVIAYEDDSASQLGVFVGLSGAADLPFGMRAWSLRNAEVVFATTLVPNPAIVKQGVRIGNQAAGALVMSDGIIDNIKVFNAVRGLNIDVTGGGDGVIERVRVTAFIAPDTLTGYAVAPNGCVLRTSPGPGIASEINNVGIMNCDFSGVPATGIGLEIEDAGVVNTVAVGNNLTANGGTALTDLGTGTQAGLNVL
jgi:hypothetical protein